MYVGNLNLRNVCRELSPVRWRSYQLGIHLGIPDHKLKLFQKEDDPLATSIDYWMRENVDDVPVSWLSIETALRNMKEGRLADHIKKNYCQCEGKTL